MTVESRLVRRTSRSEGATLLELVLVTALITAVVVLGTRSIRLYMANARVSELAHVGSELRDGLERHLAQVGRVPSRTFSGRDLNVKTLDPLSTRGFITDPDELLSVLEDNRVLAYHAPGSQQYWLLVADKKQPKLKLLVARTDAYPAAPGEWLDGLYLIRGDELQRLDSKPPTARDERTDRRQRDLEVPRV